MVDRQVTEGAVGRGSPVRALMAGLAAGRPSTARTVRIEVRVGEIERSGLEEALVASRAEGSTVEGGRQAPPSAPLDRTDGSISCRAGVMDGWAKRRDSSCRARCLEGWPRRGIRGMAPGTLALLYLWPLLVFHPGA
jgi:hypothetical protein